MSSYLTDPAGLVVALRDKFGANLLIMGYEPSDGDLNKWIEANAGRYGQVLKQLPIGQKIAFLQAIRQAAFRELARDPDRAIQINSAVATWKEQLSISDDDERKEYDRSFGLERTGL